MKTLVRGQRCKLADLTSQTDWIIGVSARFKANRTFDVCCFGLDLEGRLSDDRYFIFFNQPRSPEGSIVQLGPGGPFQQRFQFHLNQVPEFLKKIAITLTLEEDVASLLELEEGKIVLQLLNGDVVAEFSFKGADFDREKAVILLELYWKEVWRISAVAQGFNGGLKALLNHFGGEAIEEETPSHGSLPPTPNTHTQSGSTIGGPPPLPAFPPPLPPGPPPVPVR